MFRISRANMQRLMEYSWPGNIRELKNIIERSVLSSDGDTLKLEWFFEDGKENTETNGAAHNQNNMTLFAVEKEHIQKTLEECNWKINGDNGAAERLEMHPNTLRSKMKKLNIARP